MSSTEEGGLIGITYVEAVLHVVLVSVIALVAVTLWALRRRQRSSVSHDGNLQRSPANGPLAPKQAALENLPAAQQAAALIRSRRSIYPKDMNGQRVSEEEVQQLLEAANWAPTHGKTEPWRFAVLSSREAQLRAFELFLQISEENLEAGNKELDKRQAKADNWKRKLLPNISHMIMLGCRRAPNANGKLMPEWEDMAAVACAVQNLHTMATALRLAGYWSSWPAEDVRASPQFKQSVGWGPNEDTICMGCFFLGRTDVADSYRAKRGPIADKTVWHA